MRDPPYTLHGNQDLSYWLEDPVEGIWTVWLPVQAKKGSHHVLTFSGAKSAIVLPEYDEIDVDIIKNNVKTVGMSREEYFSLLKKV